MALTTQPISKKHDRKRFDCGTPSLNQFLRQTARQSSDKGVTRTYVLNEQSDPARVLGFYTLTPSLMTFPDDHPLSKRYPDQPPVLRLARMAVDSAWQGRRLGEWMLIEAINKVTAASESVGGIGCVVDAKDEQARAFYQQYGFELISPNSDGTTTLWLPINKCREVTDQCEGPS